MRTGRGPASAGPDRGGSGRSADGEFWEVGSDISGELFTIPQSRARGTALSCDWSCREGCRVGMDGIGAVGIRYYRSAVKTIANKVPDDLAVRIEKRARRLGLSKSALVRESVETLASNDDEADEPSAYDLMKDGCGCVDSGIGDLSTNPKHMEGFGR